MSPVRITPARAMTEQAVGWAKQGLTVGFVPTMGALHDGHVSLIDAARADCEKVVLSIFVNPTQFGPDEDFSTYPRTLEDDMARAEKAGVDVVFTPDVADVYPDGFATTVRVAGLTERLCGAARPGHFDGVTTVVLRLLGLVRPTRAYFGQKDYQQVAVIRRMVRDLAVPVKVVTCPTRREADGLALSSRNRYLDQAARTRARSIPGALDAARAQFAAGDTDAAEVLARMEQVLLAAGARPDYVAAVEPDTLLPVKHLRTGVVLLVAARIGDTRLIDNAVLD